MQSFLLKSILIMAVMLIIYHLFLEREKMHRFNRFYLLGALIFSLVLPFVSIQAMPGLYNVKLPEIVLAGKNDAESDTIFSWYPVVLALYAVIVLLLSVRFITGIRAFYKTAQTNRQVKIGRYTFVLVDSLPLPYTFANMVFVDRAAYEANAIPQQLFTHEQAHAGQWHTLDVIFIESLKTLFWFNPLLHYYKKAIQLNHEFLADQAVVQQGSNTGEYLELLLEKVSYKTNVALAHNLNFLITKKRLAMITKTSNPIKKIIKQLAIVPIAAAMVLVSCADENQDAKSTDTQNVAKGAVIVQDEVYNSDALQKQPEFPGGFGAFMGIVQKSFAIPEVDHDMTARIYVSFIVEADGKMSHIEVLKDPGYGLGAEAVKVLSAIKTKWQPGELNGAAVRTSYTLPITINIRS